VTHQTIDNLDCLREELRQFTGDRDWDQFHSPKNLAMALAGEVGEVCEHFQWLDEEQSCNLDEGTRAAVALELADVLIYLVRLADKLDVDLLAAAHRKMKINVEKYPADKVRGSSRKYDRY
jgi:NTP pyrophosphatase (non-canonical NTP hydrolase)